MITKEILEEVQNITDKFNSVITALYYDATIQDIYDDINHELKKVNTIKDAYKKKYLNDRVYLIREHVKKSGKLDNKINRLYLVDNNQIREIELSSLEYALLKEYNIKKHNFLWDKSYRIDFLKDLFFNNAMNSVIEITGKQFKHLKISKYKNKEINKGSVDDLTEYLKSLSSDTLIHGVSPILKSLKRDLVFQKKLDNDDILEAFKFYEQQKIHNRLIEFLDSLNNPKLIDKVRIGKDLVKSLQEMMIKTLFYHTEKKNKLFAVIKPEFLRIELIEVITLEKGDIADTLLDNYGGFIGDAYY